MNQKINHYSNWSNSVVVRYSPIEGKGIFAVNIIPAGELVLIIEGEVISGGECELREENDNNVYIFWNGDYYIDTINTDKIKYINHCCEPNCEVLDRDENSLNLVAQRDIMEGEEITMDYGYDEIYEMCNCKICKPN
ncbi:MAG: SET domain-containing protein [Bacteroidetes bacterium]|nr:SET domain-containing protein [Bacteroidota bacterium]MBU1678693.1 SET domain-containing protein [Bacteroidota bacterium]MBU2506202.1 SET domain-containing protein [Bacteroidota bacterium]